jgi:hypothetical protein
MQPIRAAGFGENTRRPALLKELDYTARLKTEVFELSKLVPGLGRAFWNISFPLRLSGRLTASTRARPMIFVGVPDEGLGVP